MQFSELSISACLALMATLTSALPQASTTLKSRQSFTNGEGTVYLQGGVAGSCGVANPDSAMIAAISTSLNNNEFQSPYCGQTIQITNIGSDDGVGGAGSSITVTVADTCEGCDESHLDLSIGAWNALTDSAPFGTVEINWNFV